MSRTAPIYGSIAEAAGNTPLVRLKKIEASAHGSEIWAKLEFMNPGGSVKDRPALQMILDAEAEGRLKPGMSIIDSTSGNTGVALALYGAARGYRVTLVMPENASSARKNMLRAFGAEIVYSDPMDGSDGAIRMVRQMVSDEPDRFFYTNQYANPSNPRAHYLHTAEEIIRELGPRLTHFVAGVGTSGTVMGNGRRLREYSDRIQIVGVEPDDEFHGLEGLKHIQTSIVPDIYDPTVLHRTIFLETDRGWNMSERLASEEGLLVGHSAGAAVAAAVMIAGELHAEGKIGVIACVLPDHASRYLEVKS